MDTKQEQLQTAKWILDKNLAWIAAADIKSGFIFTTSIAMIGVVSALMGKMLNLGINHPVIFVISSVTLGMLAAVIFCTAMVVTPRVDGPLGSNIFFGQIVSRESSLFTNEFTNLSTDQMLRDCLDQVHVNAQIANDKFFWVKFGMNTLFVTIIPWIVSVTQLLNITAGK